MKFQVYQDSKSQFRWRFVGNNAKTLADGSEGYTTKAGAEGGINLVKAGAGGGQYTVYQDARSEFRWRFVAHNAKTVADSGEGYARRADCEHGMELVKANAPTAPIDDLTRRY